jgi:hypothetical protein
MFFLTSISQKRRQRREPSVSAILIMSTVTSKKRKDLNDDASEECDRAPAIPTNVISVVLSFVQDRTTWNSVCSANKEVYKAGMGMMPPWPEIKLKLGQQIGTTK